MISLAERIVMDGIVKQLLTDNPGLSRAEVQKLLSSDKSGMNTIQNRLRDWLYVHGKGKKGCKWYPKSYAIEHGLTQKEFVNVVASTPVEEKERTDFDLYQRLYNLWFPVSLA